MILTSNRIFFGTADNTCIRIWIRQKNTKTNIILMISVSIWSVLAVTTPQFDRFVCKWSPNSKYAASSAYMHGFLHWIIIFLARWVQPLCSGTLPKSSYSSGWHCIAICGWLTGGGAMDYMSPMSATFVLRPDLRSHVCSLGSFWHMLRMPLELHSLALTGGDCDLADKEKLFSGSGTRRARAHQHGFLLFLWLIGWSSLQQNPTKQGEMLCYKYKQHDVASSAYIMVNLLLLVNMLMLQQSIQLIICSPRRLTA